MVPGGDDTDVRVLAWTMAACVLVAVTVLAIATAADRLLERAGGRILANLVLGTVLVALLVAYWVASVSTIGPTTGRSAEILTGDDGLRVWCWDGMAHDRCLERAELVLERQRVADPDRAPAAIDISDGEGDRVCHATEDGGHLCSPID